MKADYVKKLFSKYLSSLLPGFQIKGNLIFYKDFDLILRGYYFDSSNYSTNEFRLNVFVQPMYTPFEAVYFSFGYILNSKLGNSPGKWWSINPESEQNVMKEVSALMAGPGLKFLNRTKTPKDFLKRFNKFTTFFNGDYFVREIITYSLILNGNFRKASWLIKWSMREMDKDVKKYPYLYDRVKQIQPRMVLMEELMEHKKYDQSKSQLYDWAAETRRALRI